ncbi:uncharacterized protein LOC135383468 [Ornithodoros turicata]|uniref:uncharacterized protein LOC135383468 n=1 Tax=Ornithodoros turicata TaxID=34597 RepID=UPI003139B673
MGWHCSTNLIALACLLGMLTTTSVHGCTPLGKFYKDIKETPILLRQCFRNGTSLEPIDAVSITVNWTGAAYPPDELASDNTVSFARALDPDTYTCMKTKSKYDNDTDTATIMNESRIVVFVLLREPYNDQAYFMKHYEPASDVVSFKIYDTDETCVNARLLFDSLGDDYSGMVATA